MPDLTPSLSNVSAFLDVHPWAEAGLVVLAGILAAFIADRVISGVVGRWARHTTSDLDDRFVALCHGPIRTTVVLVALSIAARGLKLGPGFTAGTSSLLATVAILVWLGFGIRFGGLLLEVLSRIEDRVSFVQPSTRPLFEIAGRLVLIGGAIYLFCLAWNIDVTAWLASAGIIGIAVGFAARDTLANLFSGVFILVDAPYRIGDFVNLESGERGQVTHIGLRSTRLLTRDDIEITIPNAVIAGGKIVNESGGRWPKERIRVKVSVAYGSDIDHVRRVLMEIAGSHDELAADPAPRVRFRAFGESGLDLELLAWIEEPIARGRLLDALHTEVYNRFMNEEIEIPYPKLDLYVRSGSPATPSE